MMFTDLLQKISDRENLSADEAKHAMASILTGTVPDAQIAAFLFGMRSKGETIDELTAFVQVMRENAVKLDVITEGAVDLCGTGGDHSGTFNISTAAMFVVAGSGVPVLKHGNRSISSLSGSYDVLLELGAQPALSPANAKICFERTGMVFMFAPLFHPAMKYVMPARKSLGMRSFFNILGPLLNPAGVKRQVIGTYSRDVAHDMIRILANLDTVYAMTLHANDGLDEVSLTTLTEIYELKHSVSSDGTRFDPADLGYTMYHEDAFLGGDAVQNAKIIKAILSGNSTKAQHDIVEINAAFGIYTSGKAESLSVAREMAEASIRSGAALKALNDFALCTTTLNSQEQL
ncbi:MAG: anthranilate phosphoribosyltransferase [Bacteroidetes bacterium]|nr:anthranilate phosphoribosyltransferase [Bacteroidota bacterium]